CRPCPPQVARVRVRHGGHLPGCPVRSTGRGGPALDPVLRRGVLGGLPGRCGLRARHAVDGGPLPAPPVGDRALREIPAVAARPSRPLLILSGLVVLLVVLDLARPYARPSLKFAHWTAGPAAAGAPSGSRRARRAS